MAILFYSSWCPGDARERGGGGRKRTPERRDGGKGPDYRRTFAIKRKGRDEATRRVPNPVMAIIERVKNPRVEREEREAPGGAKS